MKKGILIFFVMMGLFILASVLFYIKVGWVKWGREDLDSKKMGYCFDVATDPTASRLFVASGKRGLHVLNLANGKLEYVTTYFDGGYYRNLKVKGDRAFIADADRGLVVIDISGNMPRTTWFQSGREAYGVHVEEDKAYVAAEEAGLEIFDISNPDSPDLLSTLKTSGEAWDVWVHNGFAYVADVDKGVTVINISSPGEPYQVGFVTWVNKNPMAEIVHGEIETIYIGAGRHGLVIVDISNPTYQKVISIYRPVRIGFVEGLATRDGFVYFTMGGGIANLSTIENGLHILDVTDRYRPKPLGKVSFLDWPEGVYVTEDFAYVANTFTGVRSVDIQNPARPFLVDTFNVSR